MRTVWFLVLLSFTYFCAMSQFANAHASALSLAMAAHQQGRIDDALKLYMRALKEMSAGGSITGPAVSKVLSNIGALYMGKGGYELASRFFGKSADADAGNVMALFNLAVVLTSKLERHEQAYEHCLKVIKMDPEHVKALHLMGNILQSLGRGATAEEYFQLADQKAQMQQQSGGDVNKTGGVLSPQEVHRRRELRAYIYNNTLLSMAVGESRQFPQHMLSTTATPGENGQELGTMTAISQTLSVTCLSRRPFVFSLRNLMTADECDAIIQRAEPLMKPSYVTGGGSGGSDAYSAASTVAAHVNNNDTRNSSTSNQRQGEKNDDSSVASAASAAADISGLYRSSDTAWLPLDATLHAMQTRLAAVMAVPTSFIQMQSEELQVCSYTRAGAQFRLHQDSSRFHPRHCTALLYLNDVESESVDGGGGGGGETWFPFANNNYMNSSINSTSTSTSGSTVDSNNRDQQNQALLRVIEQGLALYEQTQGHEQQGLEQLQPLPGVKVVPRRGDAVLFFNHAPPLLDDESDASTAMEGTTTTTTTTTTDDDPDLGSLDLSAVHAGLPVAGGGAQKWIANYWF